MNVPLGGENKFSHDSVFLGSFKMGLLTENVPAGRLRVIPMVSKFLVAGAFRAGCSRFPDVPCEGS